MGRGAHSQPGHLTAPLTRAGAAPAMYHVAPRSARADIETGGLIGGEEWDDLVWLWDHRPTAEAYANAADDVWQVDTSGLEPEPGGNPPSRHGGLAHAVIGPVSPGRLRRLS